MKVIDYVICTTILTATAVNAATIWLAVYVAALMIIGNVRHMRSFVRMETR